MIKNNQRDRLGRFKKGHNLHFKTGSRLKNYENLKNWIDNNEHPMKGKKHSEAAKEKMRLAKIGFIPWNKGKEHTSISGDKHPKWIKDRTLVKQYWTERNNPEYKNWRRKVLKRDNYKCKICGKEYAKKDKLIVHHILPWKDFPEERYNINNGITLCQKHHPRKRKEEQMLMLTFKELVEAI